MSAKVAQKKIKVLIADDHPVVRKGLRQILAEEADMDVPGEAHNAAEVLQAVESKNWDVLVLDITMPDRSGLDVLSQLKREHPKLPVLILSIHPEDQFAVRILKSGAAGYMTKETVPEELVNAIRKVFNGHKYVSSTLAERLASDLASENEKPLHETLSDREFQVMRLLASGKIVKEIAAELSLSVKTISTYRTRILEKMKMNTNAELAIFAMQNNLIEAPRLTRRHP